MRNAAAAAPGGIRHRNIGPVLALVARPRYDPIYRATEAPVFAWACAVWEKYKPAQLKFATDAAKAHKGWAQIRGPADALKCSLERFGCTIDGVVHRPCLSLIHI